ncbi:MFS transporter [Chloroflexota bacterium]
MMQDSNDQSIFYGWIVVATSFITMTIIYGLRFSFSVFYVAILDDFGWTRASTAGIYSLSLLVYGLSSPIAGFLLDRLGVKKTICLGSVLLSIGVGACSLANTIWHLYVLFGVVAAFGMACAGYIPNSTIITNWFVRRRATAIGIVLAGNGLGYLMGTVAQVLISHLEWRGAYIVLAALPIAIIVPLVILFQRQRPEDMGLSPDGDLKERSTAGSNPLPEVVGKTTIGDREWTSQEWTLGKAIRTYRFWLLFFASFTMFGIGLQILITHHVAFMVDVGFSKVFAASIHGLFGILVVVGRFGGFICDRIGREWVYTIGWVGFIIAVSLLYLVSNYSYPWLLYLYAVILGLSAGIIPTAHVSTIADFFQGKNFGLINGVITLGFGMGGALGPWLGGYIFDMTQSYNLAFASVLLGVSLAAIFIWLAAPRKVRRV